MSGLSDVLRVCQPPSVLGAVHQESSLAELRRQVPSLQAAPQLLRGGSLRRRSRAGAGLSGGRLRVSLNVGALCLPRQDYNTKEQIGSAYLNYATVEEGECCWHAAAAPAPLAK